MIKIYRITNLVNSKIYIGQTKSSLKQRWNKHCSKTSHCKLLLNSINKYGKDKFTIELIEELENKDIANHREQELIKSNNSMFPSGYNLTNGGFSFEHSQITKVKIGLAHKGLKRSKSAKLNMSKASLGKVISEQQKQAISNTLLKKSKARSVICIDTGISYRSARYAAKCMNLNIGGLSKVLNNKQNTVNGYRFKYE